MPYAGSAPLSAKLLHPPPSLATGEGDHAKHGGGGDPTRRRSARAPSTACRRSPSPAARVRKRHERRLGSLPHRRRLDVSPPPARRLRPAAAGSPHRHSARRSSIHCRSRRKPGCSGKCSVSGRMIASASCRWRHACSRSPCAWAVTASFDRPTTRSRWHSAWLGSGPPAGARSPAAFAYQLSCAPIVSATMEPFGLVTPLQEARFQSARNSPQSEVRSSRHARFELVEASAHRQFQVRHR